MNFCLENKMKILFVLLVKCHFIGLFASPVSQQDYDYIYGEYPEYPDFNPDAPGRPDISPDELESICQLPPELDYNGEDLPCLAGPQVASLGLTFW